MRNIILEKIVGLFMRVVLVYAFYLLVRGHNFPGGGFIAGIIASTGFTFYAMVFGSEKVEKMIGMSPLRWMGLGMMFIFVSAVLPLFLNKEVLTGLWIPNDFPVLGSLHIGTPLIFDTGVFLVVSGVILTIITSIMEVLKWN
jgi:multisubunit Na+/H+ antiporter MnhB subunit